MGLGLEIWPEPRLRVIVWSGLRRMVNGLGLGLGLWSGLRLSRFVNALGLGLGVWSWLKLRVRVWAKA